MGTGIGVEQLFVCTKIGQPDTHMNFIGAVELGTCGPMSSLFKDVG